MIQRYPNLAAWIVLALVLALIPLFVSNQYIITVLVLVGEFSILTVGLSLLMGYAGQISLGHATFFAIGAYATAILSTRFSLSIWLSLLMGVLASGMIGYLIGRVIFRLRGHYLAMVTLGMNVILFLILTQEVEWTGGPSGFRGVPDLTIAGIPLTSSISAYYLVWFLALVILALSINIVNSRVGRAMRALHASEVASESLGIDTTGFKVKVLALSAVYGGLAGGLHATFLGFISPSMFGITVSIELVVMAVVGGLASVWGAPFGAAAVFAIEQYMQNVVELFIPNAAGEFEVIAFGLMLILIMIFLPEGLVSGVANRVRARRLTRAGGDAPQVRGG